MISRPTVLDHKSELIHKYGGREQYIVTNNSSQKNVIINFPDR